MTSKIDIEFRAIILPYVFLYNAYGIDYIGKTIVIYFDFAHDAITFMQAIPKEYESSLGYDNHNLTLNVVRVWKQ